MRTELKEVTNFYRGYSSKQGEIMLSCTNIAKTVKDYLKFRVTNLPNSQGDPLV